MTRKLPLSSEMLFTHSLKDFWGDCKSTKWCRHIISKTSWHSCWGISWRKKSFPSKMPMKLKRFWGKFKNSTARSKLCPTVDCLIWILKRNKESYWNCWKTLENQIHEATDLIIPQPQAWSICPMKKRAIWTIRGLRFSIRHLFIIRWSGWRVVLMAGSVEVQITEPMPVPTPRQRIKEAEHGDRYCLSIQWSTRLTTIGVATMDPSNERAA